MSDYTQENLTEIRQAIIALATGKRIARITIDGETIEYALVDLPKLQALERIIAADLDDGTAITSFFLTAGKGF